MADPLLMTKLYIPEPRPNLVSRERLRAALRQGLEAGRKLTLVSAPAGFGKTTLLSEWVLDAGRPTAWLSLDGADNHPLTFMRYLITALRQVEPGVGEAALEMLAQPQLPSAAALVTPLVNDILTSEARLLLVLDDYHLITARPIHEIVGFLLEHQPSGLHMAISTREDPPLPLHQLRARGQLTELRQRDLRFTTDEAADFLNRTMGLDLPADAVAALEARTEGWIAGLQLAALAIQKDADDAESFVAAFTGDDRYVMDYLIAEVLDRQPAPIRDFLRQTAILDRLTAPLCDALTGREDGQAVLEQLDAANLFIVPLDHRREWYRYHRLLAEMMRMTLPRSEEMSLHQRASDWYESSGMLGQAVHHALAYASLSGDAASAEAMIRRTADEMLLQGAVLTVRGWLDALSEGRIRAVPELAVLMGWTLTLSGDMAGGRAWADAAETRFTEDEPAIVRGKLLLLRSFISLMEDGSYERASALAREALALLPGDDLHWRVLGLWVLAESLERTGSVSEAVEAFRQARRAGLALGSHVFVVTIEMSLALALNNQGQRAEAIALCEEAIRAHVEAEGETAPSVGLLYGRLGMLHYEADNLEEAAACHERGLIIGAELGSEIIQTIVRGLAAPAWYALGEVAKALDALQEAERAVAETNYGDAGWYTAWLVNFRLRHGDLDFARRWAERSALSPEGEPDYLHIDLHLAYARLLLADDRLNDAHRWLETLERFTRLRGLDRQRLSVLVLQALAADREGDQRTAHRLLADALGIAAPGDYVRAFVDEDPRVIALLEGVLHESPAFVSRVMSAAGLSAQMAPTPQPLIEPLSDRELEVLAEIAAGLSNREIAERLVISVGTVKTHINNIYGKLEVGSRTEAIAKAHALHLLG